MVKVRGCGVFYIQNRVNLGVGFGPSVVDGKKTHFQKKFLLKSDMIEGSILNMNNGKPIYIDANKHDDA